MVAFFLSLSQSSETVKNKWPREIVGTRSTGREAHGKGGFPSKSPVIWSRVPETNLPQRQVYRAFIYENVVSVGRVKVNPA